MSKVFAILFLICLIYLPWLLVSSIWRKAVRGRLYRRALIVAVTAILSPIGFSYFESRDAQEAGFLGLSDREDAERAGITDPAIWAPMREERAAQERENRKKAAEERAAKAENEARLKQEEQAAKEKAEAEIKAAEKAKCMSDVRCAWDSVSIDLLVDCKIAIQGLAKWDFEWTNEWTESAFMPAGWSKSKKGILMAIGKNLKLQNGFGAWKHVSYLCAYDPVAKRVVDASVF